MLRATTLAGLLVALLLSAGQACADELLIAAVGPLAVTPISGKYAMFGEEISRGAELAVRDANAAGGAAGQTLKLVLADDACDPAQAESVAGELVRQGVALVVGHFCSGASLAAAPIYHAAGILMISPASVNSRLTEQGFANVFRTCGRDDVQAVFAAEYAIDRGHAQRVAIVDDDSTFGRGLADEFRSQLNRRGVFEVLNAKIAQGDTQFAELIDRMRTAATGFVYFGGYHAEAGLFVREAHEAALGATVMVTSAAATREFADLAGPGADGTLMPFLPDFRRAAPAREVVGRFAAEGYNAEGYTLNAYAAVQVFVEASGRAGSTQSAAIAAAMHGASFDTVLGPIEFDEKGDVKNMRYSMYRWENGDYREICCGDNGG